MFRTSSLFKSWVNEKALKEIDSLTSENDAFEQRLIYSESLRKVFSILVSNLEIESVTQKVVDSVASDLGYSGGNIFLLDPTGSYLSPIKATDNALSNAAQKLMPFKIQDLRYDLSKRDNLVVESYHTKEILQSGSLADFAPTPIVAKVARVVQKFTGTKVVLAVPLVYKDVVVGVIDILSPKKTVEKLELEMLYAFGNICAIVVNNSTLFNQNKENLSQIKSIFELSESLNSVFEKDKVLQIAANSVAYDLGYIGTAIAEKTSEGKMKVLAVTESAPMKAAEKLLGFKYTDISVRLEDFRDRGLIELEVLERELEFLATDDFLKVAVPVVPDSVVKEIGKIIGATTSVVLPLKMRTGNKGIIIFMIRGKLAADLNDKDKEYMKTVSRVISAALENANYFEENKKQLELVQSKNTQLQSIFNISRAVTSKLESKEIMQAAVDSIPTKMGYIAGAIVLKVDEKKLKIISVSNTKTINAAFTLIGKKYQDIDIDLTVKEYLGLFGVEIMNSGVEFAVTNDFTKTALPIVPKHLVKPLQKLTGIKSVAVCSFTIKGQNPGFLVFLIGDKFAEEVTSQDQEYMQTITKVISVALENAMVFEENRKALEEIKLKSQELAGKNQQLAIKTADLEDKNTALEDARRRERDMIDIMGHELRTPLSVIKMTLGLVDSKVHDNKGQLTNEDAEKYVHRMKDSLEREVRLLETMLSSTKIEAGRVELFLEKVDLNKVVENSILAHKSKAKLKGLDIETEGLKDRIFVYADDIRLAEVIDNLVDNAIKYTEMGKVVIKVDNSKKNAIKVSIIDTGVGIPEDAIKKLGTKFFRVQQYTTNNAGIDIVRPGGTGLGLYVAMSLIKRMGGDLEIKSVVGKGSEFSFTVPQYADQEVSVAQKDVSKNLFDKLGLKK